MTVTNGFEQLEGKVTIFTALLQGTNKKNDELGNFRAKKNTKTVSFHRFDFCGGYNK